MKSILLPNSASISNSWDSAARLVGTFLKDSAGMVLNSRAYEYGTGTNWYGWTHNSISNQTRTDGSYVRYTGADVLTKAEAFGPSGAARLQLRR